VSEHVLDYLIIGAGPAGLQLGQLLAADGRDYLIVEGGDAPGTFFTRFPRHRTLISSNKVYNGTDDPELNMRMDWNSLLSDNPQLLFKHYSKKYFPPADELVRYLADFAKAFELNVRYGTRIVNVTRDERGFTATDQDGTTYTAKRLVAATGVSRPYIPDIPGIEHIEQYVSVNVDPEDFIDQRVLIIGKGNSAFETADNLIETAAVIHVAGPSSVRLAWKTHYVGHLRAVNNNFLDTYQLKSNNAILDGHVRSIEKTDDGFRVRFAFSRADEVVKELRYDRVIGCTGFRFDASIFDETCRPELIHKDRFPRQNPSYESVNVPDLFFVGTVTQQRDFKHGTSGFIHGFRYGVRALHRILSERYHAQPWPARALARTPEALTEAVIERVNRTSALWQQFGVIGDVIDASGANGPVYREEVPVAYADGPDHYVITLEYGPDHDKIDPFDITVRRIAQDTPGQAHDAAYLHPVVRHHRAGELVATHHVAENLENEWNRPAHRAALLDFFTAELA
jgi:thioredoxin reductase